MRIPERGIQSGDAIDLSGGDPDPARIVAAVRTDQSAVECPTPGAVHDHVGLVVPDRTFQRRAGLAAAARSRGSTAPCRDELERVREGLAEVDPPAVGLDELRERVAEAGTERDRLRERVAAVRGKVQGLREAGVDASGAEAELAETAATLAETETRRAAAEQAFEHARRRAREARNVRERRLRLEDRAANLERSARAWLADEIRPAVDRSARATPGGTADSFADAGPVTAVLAAARVAEVDAPVVLACGRFPSAAGAAEWLDAPVIRCSVPRTQ